MATVLKLWPQLSWRLLTRQVAGIFILILRERGHLRPVMSKQKRRRKTWQIILSAAQSWASAVTAGGLHSVFFVIFGLMAGYGPSFQVRAATYCLNDVPFTDAGTEICVCDGD